jgi:hypothetical protein
MLHLDLCVCVCVYMGDYDGIKTLLVEINIDYCATYTHNKHITITTGNEKIR